MPCPFQSPQCQGAPPILGSPLCALCAELALNADLTAHLETFHAHPKHVDFVRDELKDRLAKKNRDARPRPPIRINPGEHVNTAVVKGPKADPSIMKSNSNRSPGDKNCALCATAGCINLSSGYVTLTTGAIAMMLKASDDLYAYGDDREAQYKGIVAKTTAHLPDRECVIHGTDEDRMNLNKTLAVMNSYPDGTVFVVSCSGRIEGVNILGGHWLNAVKLNGVVQFVDFQSDQPHRNGVAHVSDKPCLGIFDTDFVDPMMQILAYPLKKAPLIITNRQIQSPSHQKRLNEAQQSPNTVINDSPVRQAQDTVINNGPRQPQRLGANLGSRPAWMKPHDDIQQPQNLVINNGPPQNLVINNGPPQNTVINDRPPRQAQNLVINNGPRRAQRLGANPGSRPAWTAPSDDIQQAQNLVINNGPQMPLTMLPSPINLPLPSSSPQQVISLSPKVESKEGS